MQLGGFLNMFRALTGIQKKKEIADNQCADAVGKQSPQQLPALDRLDHTARALIDVFPHMVCIKDGAGRWQLANRAYLKLLNLRDVAYQGKTDEELSRYDTGCTMYLLETVLTDDQAWHKRGLLYCIETLHQGDEGSIILEVRKQPVFDAQGNRKLLVVVAQDVTQRKLEEDRTELLASVFDNTMLGMLIMDQALRILHINNAFSILTGYSAEDLVNLDLSVLAGASYGRDFFRIMRATVAKKGHWQGEITYRCKSGESFPAWLSMMAKKSSDGKIGHYVGIFSDISEKKASENRVRSTEEGMRQLERQAYYDELTGLPKRALFFQRVEQVLARVAKKELASAILFLDLDRFKKINDTLGHRSGDEVLKHAAQRFLGHLRKDDLITRISGDEFAILLCNPKKPEQTAYTASIVAQKIISDFASPIQIGTQEVFVSTSIGIALYPQDGTEPEQLLKNADMAMYHAKRNGGDNYQFFKRELNATSTEKFYLESQLHKALDGGQFTLYFQPQIDAQTGEIIGAESLLRWQLPRKGMIPPTQFIPLTEETGLIVPIGQWILEYACEKQKEWLDAGYPIQRIAINLSARQFYEPEFASQIEKVLEKTGLDPKHLELEITESILMEDTKRTKNTLLRLSQMGIGLSLDDFGTGYSSLAYLKHFPIDNVKIDRSFVTDLPQNENDAAISTAIIAMAHTLGLLVIAEGVETEEQFHFLKNQQCDAIQGYFFSRPLPESEFESLLKSPECMVRQVHARSAGEGSSIDSSAGTNFSQIKQGETKPISLASPAGRS